MPRKVKTFPGPVVNGARYVELKSWRKFFPYVSGKLKNPQEYIFRGQREAMWHLETSLDRALKELGHQVNIARHLEQFRLATRGRLHLSRQELDRDERKWWALGQHYGLKTPLLDWTGSPFVALYFAFEEPRQSRRGARAVFALSRPLVASMSESIAQKQSERPARADILEIITPETDEIARLVSQGGLFTRATPGAPVENWVKTHFRGSTSEVLVKIVVPEAGTDRLEVLRALNGMNIIVRLSFQTLRDQQSSAT